MGASTIRRSADFKIAHTPNSAAQAHVRLHTNHPNYPEQRAVLGLHVARAARPAWGRRVRCGRGALAVRAPQPRESIVRCAEARACRASRARVANRQTA